MRAEDLLRRLGSGVRPVGGERAVSDPFRPDFAGLLGAARAGVIRSGRSVVLDRDLDVELTGDQREELDAAADAAEAAGAGVLAAVVGEVALMVDVGARAAREARGLRGEGEDRAAVVTGVGAVVVLTRTERDKEEGERVAPVLRKSPPARFANASLVRQLSSGE